MTLSVQIGLEVGVYCRPHQAVTETNDAVVFVEMLVEKDRFITKAIEEKQNLVAQILNVPLQDFQHVAEVCEPRNSLRF